MPFEWNPLSTVHNGGGVKSQNVCETLTAAPLRVKIREIEKRGSYTPAGEPAK